MKLSAHFSLDEFTVSRTAAVYGIDNTPPPEVVANLGRLAAQMERVRVALGGRPISVNSGYRCPALNKQVKGAGNSQHLTGEAVDFICPAFGTPAQIVATIRKAGIMHDQLIIEFPNSASGGWVHFSFVASGNRNMALQIDETGTRNV